MIGVRDIVGVDTWGPRAVELLCVLRGEIILVDRIRSDPAERELLLGPDRRVADIRDLPPRLDGFATERPLERLGE